MKKLTLDEKLAIFFQGQPNRWLASVAQDAKGRALLPLDEVCFPWLADEGPVIMMYGTVLGSAWEYGGEFQGLVPVRVSAHFCETFRMIPILMLPPITLIKTPADVWVRNQLAQKITESNIITLLQAGGRLHINKIPIVAS